MIDSKLFQLESLKKLKIELEKSYLKEYSSIKEKINLKQQKVFSKYVTDNSLAGMESFLVFRNELEYFQDILDYFIKESKIKNFETNNFLKEICLNIREDFGSEDFRYINLERTSPDTKNILKTLKDIITETSKKLEIVQEEYIKTKNDIQFYLEADGDPSIKGVDVNLKKKKTPPLKIIQFKEAEENLNNIWDYGFQLYKSLTYKVIPVKSDGLVSYSHFSEPGISYINLLDRNLLETVDDLIHENAHHHLNLILKKHKILKKNDPEQKYYSPWRDSLRSIYAILHASFTFSFAAKLFYHILNTDPSSLKNWKMEYLETSRFRFIEETKMLTYSLDDLNRNNALFTKKGLELLEQLSNWNKENEKMARLIQKKISNKKNIEKIYSLQKKLTSATFEYKRYADIKASKK